MPKVLDKFKPVSNPNWIAELGPDVPRRILLNLKKKVQQCQR